MSDNAQSTKKSDSSVKEKDEKIVFDEFEAVFINATSFDVILDNASQPLLDSGKPVLDSTGNPVYELNPNFPPSVRILPKRGRTKFSDGRSVSIFADGLDFYIAAKEFVEKVDSDKKVKDELVKAFERRKQNSIVDPF